MKNIQNNLRILYICRIFVPEMMKEKDTVLCNTAVIDCKIALSKA